MEQHSPDKLADLIHRELMKLPEQKAPERLIRDVLARIEQRRHRWWQREWLAWPLAARLLSGGGLCLLLGALIFGLTQLPPWFASGALQEGTARLIDTVSDALAPFTTLGRAALLILRPLAHPWILTSVAVLSLGMYLTCVAVGTACVRLAWASPRPR